MEIYIKVKVKIMCSNFTLLRVKVWNYVNCKYQKVLGFFGN